MTYLLLSLNYSSSEQYFVGCYPDKELAFEAALDKLAFYQFGQKDPDVPEDVVFNPTCPKNVLEAFYGCGEINAWLAEEKDSHGEEWAFGVIELPQHYEEKD